MRACRVFPVLSRLAAVAAMLAVLFGTAALSTAPVASAEPASVTAVSSVSSGAGVSNASVPDAGSGPVVLAQDDSGPELDPQTKADADKAKSKFVVALIAAALLGIIVWGRIVRRKRSKKNG
ncbi:hypothetical protein [Prauserella rugosa]|uniref:MYXO-CTERM domain-containing protein n=1 Tax=Prauserella rugosa TaxID=43354 RepID=A0A660CFU5_9PSEU|nr:hypothetical protein [Prauserella rugosa]TWH22370.1 hypothetical protein JD82_04251 [Prauserella rugosa]